MALFKLENYWKEFKHLRVYTVLIFLAILLSYSTNIFLSEGTLMKIGTEDDLFEVLTAICFFTASIVMFVSSKFKNVFLLGFAIVFLFGAGEEISWGQRIFNFETPQNLKSINVQGEFTLHNIEVFNKRNMDGSAKENWDRLLEIYFVFLLLSGFYGVVLPILVNHVTRISEITRRFKVPVPPLSIGVWFPIAWFSFYFVRFMLPVDLDLQYYDSNGEFFEFSISYIYLTISYYFFDIRNENKYGVEIERIF